MKIKLKTVLQPFNRILFSRIFFFFLHSIIFIQLEYGFFAMLGAQQKLLFAYQPDIDIKRYFSNALASSWTAEKNQRIISFNWIFLLLSLSFSVAARSHFIQFCIYRTYQSMANPTTMLQQQVDWMHATNLLSTKCA